MKRKILFIGLISFFVFLPIFSYAQQPEEIKITTYYPSSSGEYTELRAKRAAIGDNYFSRNYICWNDPPGSCPAGAAIVPAEVDLMVEGNIGIALPNDFNMIQCNQPGCTESWVQGARIAMVGLSQSGKDRVGFDSQVKLSPEQIWVGAKFLRVAQNAWSGGHDFIDAVESAVIDNDGKENFSLFGSLSNYNSQGGIGAGVFGIARPSALVNTADKGGGDMNFFAGAFDGRVHIGQMVDMGTPDPKDDLFTGSPLWAKGAYGGSGGYDNWAMNSKLSIYNTYPPVNGLQNMAIRTDSFMTAPGEGIGVGAVLGDVWPQFETNSTHDYAAAVVGGMHDTNGSKFALDSSLALYNSWYRLGAAVMGDAKPLTIDVSDNGGDKMNLYAGYFTGSVHIGEKIDFGGKGDPKDFHFTGEAWRGGKWDLNPGNNTLTAKLSIWGPFPPVNGEQRFGIRAESSTPTEGIALGGYLCNTWPQVPDTNGKDLFSAVAGNLHDANPNFGVYGNLAVTNTAAVVGGYPSGIHTGVYGRADPPMPNDIVHSVDFNPNGGSPGKQPLWAGFFDGNVMIINRKYWTLTPYGWDYVHRGGLAISDVEHAFMSPLTVDNLPKTAGGYRYVKWDWQTGAFYQDVSSARYKKDIQNFKTDFSKILKLEAKTYTDAASGEKEIGYLAEDFDKLGLKEVVLYKENKPDALKYDKIPLYLVEILKEQQQRIALLEKEVAQLKEKIK